mgnify:CR=1 FL=1
MNVKVVFVYIDTIDHGTGYYLSNWDLVVSRAVFQVRESPSIAVMWVDDL